jgi:hypothetical protein
MTPQEQRLQLFAQFGVQDAKVSVIYLHPPEADCWICEERCLCQQGVPRYEDQIVPDEYEGEWGGAATCLRCFYVVRGLQAEHPGRMISVMFVRMLIKGEVYGR